MAGEQVAPPDAPSTDAPEAEAAPETEAREWATLGRDLLMGNAVAWRDGDRAVDRLIWAGDTDSRDPIFHDTLVTFMRRPKYLDAIEKGPGGSRLRSMVAAHVARYADYFYTQNGPLGERFDGQTAELAAGVESMLRRGNPRLWEMLHSDENSKMGNFLYFASTGTQWHGMNLLLHQVLSSYIEDPGSFRQNVTYDVNYETTTDRIRTCASWYAVEVIRRPETYESIFSRTEELSDQDFQNLIDAITARLREGEQRIWQGEQMDVIWTNFLRPDQGTEWTQTYQILHNALVHNMREGAALAKRALRSENLRTHEQRVRQYAQALTNNPKAFTERFPEDIDAQQVIKTAQNYLQEVT